GVVLIGGVVVGGGGGLGAEEYEQILHRADQHNAVILAAQDRNGWGAWTATADLRQLFSIFL
ncbi:MAG: hypothetical protein SX243_13970, partial [Acidobacteriota bacterium]|nr:hypothetical protein [Acidobacteriota bacterium]